MKEMILHLFKHVLFQKLKEDSLLSKYQEIEAQYNLPGGW